jgi:regulator of sirC expression with transglutaminase-like and TPR domain
MDFATTPSTQRDQSGAILKLLADDDPSVVALVLEQLGLQPTENQVRLEQLLQNASGRARWVLLAELERVKIGDPERALQEACRQLKNVADFEDFCWKMSLYHDPKAPIYESKQRLDGLARRVSAELVDNAGNREQLVALRQVLVEEEKFRGNEDNYYDPQNSFLDKVIATRLGWPTSLTAIYMLVGHRVGIAVEPVCFPGHFLARIGSCYFTPFNAAVDVERAKLEEKLAEPGFNSDYDVLDRTPLPLMAQRMANNLVSIYTKADDIDNLLRWQTVLTWLQEISL